MTSTISRLWKNDCGYSIMLICHDGRSWVEVRDREGISVLYHEFEYWQQAQARREAEALALLSHAQETTVAFAA